MIRAALHIINPWSFDGEFKNLFCSEKQISENKNYCFEILYCDRDVVEIDVDLNWRGRDHAGPEITLGIFGYAFHFQIYDKRHWNEDTNNWYTQAELQIELANYENSEKDRL